ncbi:3-hydroxyacyl-[acyl-carrier-protein] dehydratase FabZ [Rickettsiales bacterium Ac37b]|nr:3-hydroxyacyl-[acyl-carrier-protein] dehydratase FabZ [Rickettsiales bacterium Ac37b]
MPNKIINIEQILKMIPHRYPFLLIDKVIELVPDQYALGIKNVTFNEPHFLGHFPEKPIMPGVLIIEAMAQTSAVLVVDTLGDEAENKLVYFMSIEEARFRKTVVPGDTMYIRVTKDRNRGKVWRFNAEAMVEDSKVAEATFTAMIMDRE